MDGWIDDQLVGWMIIFVVSSQLMVQASLSCFTFTFTFTFTFSPARLTYVIVFGNSVMHLLFPSIDIHRNTCWFFRAIVSKVQGAVSWSWLCRPCLIPVRFFSVSSNSLIVSRYFLTGHSRQCFSIKGTC
jgi:hypothetical protein